MTDTSTYLTHKSPKQHSEGVNFEFVSNEEKVNGKPARFTNQKVLPILADETHPLFDDAWDQFAKIYSPRIKEWAKSLGCPKHRIDSVVNATFCKAKEAILNNKYDPTRSSLKGYIKTLTDYNNKGEYYSESTLADAYKRTGRKAKNPSAEYDPIAGKGFLLSSFYCKKWFIFRPQQFICQEEPAAAILTIYKIHG